MPHEKVEKLVLPMQDIGPSTRVRARRLASIP